MAITIDELLEARELVTELPESQVLSRENVKALVGPAIALWQKQTNEDPEKRHPFIQETGDITPVNNVANLATELDKFAMRLEHLKEGDIVIPLANPPNYKVRFVSRDRFAVVGRQDAFYVLAFLDGSQLTFRHPTIASFVTPFRIRSVVFPQDLTDMPKSVGPELALIVADLAKQQLFREARGLDLPVGS